MILPINWLRQYVKTNQTPNEIAEYLTAIGLMLDRPVIDSEFGPILDLEHRMDRSDWLSILGCTRDYAAIAELDLISPEGLVPESKGNGEVEIKVEAEDLVKRFNTRVFKNIKVGESPKWLKNAIESYGIPSKNNIVDITNYVMLELGQTLHAQDISKISGNKLILRRAKNGETVETLLGENIELDEETLVIADDEKVVVIGGIVGGKTTGIDENTKDIILDAGNYNQSNIRKTSRRINVRNESSSRNEKFLHPHATQVAIERATKLILEIAGGEYYENDDYYPDEVPFNTMKLRYSRVEKIGGIKINLEKITEILRRLEYKILDETSDGLELKIPYFRTDVLVEDDIVADILRINNYINIPHELINAAPPKEVTPAYLGFEDQIRDELVKLGLHEHITNPLVKYDKEDKTQIKMENALNSAQDGLRTSIYNTLRPVLDVYKKHRLDNAFLFEVGKTYHQTGNSYEDLQEIRVVEGVIELGENVVAANNRLKKAVAAFLQNLGIDNVRYTKGKEDKDATEKSAILYHGDLELGEIKIDSFKFYTENLLKAEKKELRTQSKILNLSTEDITVEVDRDKPLGEVMEELKEKHPNAVSIEYIETFEKDGKLSVTFRIKI